MAELPDTLTVGTTTYTLRRYQRSAGHGWVRAVGSYRGMPGTEHRAEVGAGLREALDRIVELEARVAELEIKADLEYPS